MCQVQHLQPFSHRQKRFLCFVPYAKNTTHITTLTHDVHLAWTWHIKSRKAQMVERFCELCTSVEWTPHLFIFSFSVELWGDVEWKKKHQSRMAKPLLFSSSPKNSASPALAVKQSCAHTFHLNFVSKLSWMFSCSLQKLFYHLTNSLVMENWNQI